MKVQSVQLKHFKKFRSHIEFDFTDPETGLARDMIVLVGMNGTGKTSILQAIAATLGTATGRLKEPASLEWAGFNYELLGSNWEGFEPLVAALLQSSASRHQLKTTWTGGSGKLPSPLNLQYCETKAIELINQFRQAVATVTQERFAENLAIDKSYLAIH